MESEPPLNWDFLPAQDEPAQAPGPAPTRTSRSRPALKVDWAEAGPSPLASAPVNTPQPIHSPLRASGTSPGSSPPRPSTGPISDLDAALADVDARFDEMMSGEAIVPHPDEAPPDLSDVRELFAQIASGYMRQVRDFIIELQWGETPREWIAICRPSVTSLRKASEQMRMTGLCAGLDDFLGALELVSASGGAAIGGEGRDLLLTTYRVLSELLPQTFALGEERNQREAIIVHSLLQQVPDVGKVTIDKLYAAGLGALDMMFVAKPDDVASAAGIERLLAERIVQRFRWYRTEIESASPDESRTFERRRLEELVRDLRLRHQEYEEAAATPTDDGSRRKRDLRQARAALVSEVAVVLARLGEVQLVRDLERLAFDRKIDILERRLRALESESS